MLFKSAFILCSTAALASASGQYEFVLADRLGDSLRIHSRDAAGRVRWMDALFTTEPIYAPQATSLSIIAAGNRSIPVPEFSRIIWANPANFDLTDYGGSFPIGLGSDMFRQLQSAVLIPRNGEHVFITNPNDYARYCYNNVVQSVQANSRGNLHVSISLVVGDDTVEGVTASREVSLSPGKFSVVPNWVFTLIQNLVDRHGCSPDAMTTQLPSIVYNFDTFEIDMEPQDYVEEIDGRCELKIENSINRITLGTNILKNLGIIFDYRRNKIGICDPN